MAHYEPGRYRCTVVSQGFGNSKQKGTPYFYLTIKPQERIVSSEVAERCNDSYEREIMMYITEGTIKYVVPKLRSMGWDGNDWSDLDPQSRNDFHSFEGQEVTASCEIEHVDDKSYEKWNLSEGKSFEHERNDNVVRTLNAMFGKALKANGSGKPTKPKPPTKRETVPAEDEHGVLADDSEIPF